MNRGYTVRYREDFIELRPVIVHEPLWRRINWEGIGVLLVVVILWGIIIASVLHGLGH